MAPPCRPPSRPVHREGSLAEGYPQGHPSGLRRQAGLHEKQKERDVSLQVATEAAPSWRPWMSWFPIVLPAWLAVLYILPSRPLLLIAATFALFLFGATTTGLGRRHAGALIALGAYGILFKLNLANTPISYRLAGLLAVSVGLSPLVLLPLGRKAGFPIIHAFGLIAAIYAAVSSMLSRTANTVSEAGLPPGDRTRGLLMFTVFVAVVVLAAKLVPQNPIRTDDYAKVDTKMLSRGWLLIIGSFVGSVALDILRARPALGGISAVIDQARTVGFLLMWFAWLDGQLPRGQAIVAVGAVAFDIVNSFGTTLLYGGAPTLIGGLLLYMALRRRVPWGLVTLIVCLAVMLTVVKGDVRLSQSTGPRKSQLQTGVSIIRRAAAPSAYTSDKISDAAGRFAYTASDLLAFFSHVVPDRYPYADRSTYRFALLAPIPRVVVPFKPTSTFANTLGRQYGLLAPSDTGTSPNLPLAAEAYVNFGYGGIVVIGMVYGLLMALVSVRLRAASLAMLLLASMIGRQFMVGLESDSSYVVGGVLTAAVLFYPVVRWLSPANRSTPETTARPVPS